MPNDGWTPSKFKKPRTGEAKLKVRYRCGWESKWEYRADQLVWDDRGDPWDIVAVKRA